MNLDPISSRFGETRLEQLLGFIGLIAMVVGVISLLLELEAITFRVAWAVSLVAIIGWNVLVFLRQRRT